MAPRVNPCGKQYCSPLSVIVSSADQTRSRFIARQPIFDCALKVAGYELLFRQSRENVCAAQNSDYASESTLDTTILVGVNTLSNGRSMYVNCARSSLINGFPTLFSPAMTVVEILESVEPDPDVIEACRELKEAGYRIALDGFVDEPRVTPFLRFTDILKVDFRMTSAESRAAVARNFANTGVRLLAKKVETQEELAAAQQLGYTMFQGYFFSKPSMFHTRDISASRATYMRILQVVNAPELNFVEVEALIKSDPALCYRFFRYLNSAAFPIRGEVKSIVQAAMLLGEQNTRKWLTLVCAVMANEGQPAELVNLALVRARFCELLARHTATSESASFMVGLFSLMDAILGTPLKTLVQLVLLPVDVTAALLGEDNVLRRTGELVLAFEKAEWSACERLASRLRISENAINQAHMEAVEWVQGLQLA